MSVIGLPVHTGMPYGDSATKVAGGIVNQTGGDGPDVMPNCAASTGVQCVSIVGGGHEHDAVYNYRRDLEPVRVAGMEHPLRPQLAHVAQVNLGEFAIAAPGEISIIGEPIRSRRVGFRVS